MILRRRDELLLANAVLLKVDDWCSHRDRLLPLVLSRLKDSNVASQPSERVVILLTVHVAGNVRLDGYRLLVLSDLDVVAEALDHRVLRSLLSNYSKD